MIFYLELGQVVSNLILQQQIESAAKLIDIIV